MPLIALRGTVLLEELGDQVAVYLVPTRETHLVDRSGALLLEHLNDGASSRDGLIRILEESHPGAGRAELEAYLDGTLARWSEAGLLI